MAHVYCVRKRNFGGQRFALCDELATTVGRDDALVRGYVQHQEQERQRLDQLQFWSCTAAFSRSNIRGSGLASPGRFERPAH